jgi:hypothetical protein
MMGFPKLGRFGEPGGAGDDGVEDAFPEMLSDLGHDLLGKAGSAVEHGHDDTEQVEGGVDTTIAELVEEAVDGGDAFQGVVLALERDHEVLGGREGIQCQKAERGRAVEHENVELATVANRLQQGSQASEAVVESAQLQFHAAEVDLAGDRGKPLEGSGFDPFHGGAVAQKRAVETSALGFFETESAGGIGLGIEIDEQHALAAGGHARGKIDGGGGFSDTAFLVGDGEDGRRHGAI